MHTVDFGADISWLNRHDAPLRQAPCRKYLHISLELILSSRLLRRVSTAGPLARDARSERAWGAPDLFLWKGNGNLKFPAKVKARSLFQHCRFTRSGLRHSRARGAGVLLPRRGRSVQVVRGLRERFRTAG